MFVANCRVSLDQMQALLEKFSSITTGTTNGQVSLHEFSKYLQLPESPALGDVFALYDRVRDNTHLVQNTSRGRSWLNITL